MQQQYDIIIIGGGPIGAATAYYLSQQKGNRSVALLTAEQKDERPRNAAYCFAGGSVRMWWTDPKMAAMTNETAQLIETLNAQGTDIGAVRDRYVLVHRGMEVPSWNINGEKLVQYFLEETQKNGVEVIRGDTVQSIEERGGTNVVKTAQQEYTARKILVAAGLSIEKLFPEAPFCYKKRELLVFDTPIIEERAPFPHTVVPLGDGLIFSFIKKLDGVPKFILGQEDLIEYNERWEEENILPFLVEQGLYKLMPFLKDARVEKILWSFDNEKKHPQFYEPKPGILAVSCGSAVRSCAWIGKETARRLLV